MVEYREIVRDMVSKEEKTFEELSKEVMDHLGISQEEFLNLHSQYMSNPMYS